MIVVQIPAAIAGAATWIPCVAVEVKCRQLGCIDCPCLAHSFPHVHRRYLMKFFRRVNAIRNTAAGVVVGAFGHIRSGSRKSERLVVTPQRQISPGRAFSFGRLQLLPTRSSRPWEATAKMRTIDLKKENIPPSYTKEDTAHLEEPVHHHDSAAEIFEHVIKHNQSRSRTEGERRLHSVSDTDANARDMKVDILNIKDGLALSSAAPVLRVKSGNRLARHFSESSNEEKRPLMRESPKMRRAFTEGVGIVPAKRQHSFRDDVGHAASETFLITRLTFSLLRYLGVGYRWITKFLALGLYAMFLMPGFVQVGYHYFFSKHVHRSIIYGEQPRNRLDLYIPDESSIQKPVVIFITGGAWIIGYKAWGALLGLQLLDRDIMVCCVDYRNFPQGGVSDMVEDVCTGIGFIINNIDQYGGDPDRIFLAGQSAGSHLAACALVEQARIEIGQKEGTLTWTTSQIKGFMGLSGGYNLPKLVDHFHKRGLYKSIFLNVMEGETSLPLYSPELAVRSEAFAPAIPLLPPIHLFHGTADYSIPHEASVKFAEALLAAGATVDTKFYPDKTHTDVFLQDPMRGGYDALFEDLVAVVHADDEEAKARDARAPLRRRLVPEFLLQLARSISPF